MRLVSGRRKRIGLRNLIDRLERSTLPPRAPADSLGAVDDVALMHERLLVVGSRQIGETGLARTERVRLDPGAIRSLGI